MVKSDIDHNLLTEAKFTANMELKEREKKNMKI